MEGEEHDPDVSEALADFVGYLDTGEVGQGMVQNNEIGL